MLVLFQYRFGMPSAGECILNIQFATFFLLIIFMLYCYFSTWYEGTVHLILPITSYRGRNAQCLPLRSFRCLFYVSTLN